MEELTLYVTKEQEGLRLDKCIAVLVPGLSRSYVQKLIGEGSVLLNDAAARAKDAVKDLDEIRVMLPRPQELSVEAENIPLEIVFEDKDIVIVNKPKGMVVHPAAGHFSGTLVNGLLYHCGASLSGINGVLRPGIVHRIDKDTTGILVVCKNDAAHKSLAEQFKAHSITRRYEAIVYGAFDEPEGRIETFLCRHPEDRLKMTVSASKGKYAATNYRVLGQCEKKYSHILCTLETGRTHQIRAHMSGVGHPLLGDTVYGPKKDPFHMDGQALHAGVLGFLHPGTGEYVEFSAPLPEYFQGLLQMLHMVPVSKNDSGADAGTEKTGIVKDVSL